MDSDYFSTDFDLYLDSDYLSIMDPDFARAPSTDKLSAAGKLLEAAVEKSAAEETGLTNLIAGSE